MSTKNAVVEYERPDAGELLVEAVDFLVVAKDIYVNSPAMYNLAAEQLQEVKLAIKTHTERRLGITRKMDDLKKDVMNLFAPAITKLEEVKGLLEGAMLSYNNEQERLRKEEQNRLDAIAMIERNRLEEEARKANTEALRLETAAAEEAAKAKTPEAAANIIAKAASAAEAKREAAEAAHMTAQVVVAAPSSVVAPTASGTSVRKTWKGKCVDKSQLIKYVAEHPEYMALVEVDEQALNMLAKSQKENMHIPGCESYLDIGITSRKA